MTRQEAIEIFKNMLVYESELAEAKQIAIEALEKNPSEDSINRKSKGMTLLTEAYKRGYIDGAKQSRAEGEWVEVVKRTEQYDKEGRKSWAVIYQCPNCGFVLNAIENHITQYNYCPNCGAKMRLE